LWLLLLLKRKKNNYNCHLENMYVAKIYLINVCLPYFNPEHCLLKPKLRTSHEKRCVIIHHFDGQSLLIEIAKKYLPRHVHRARLFSFFFSNND